MPDYACRFCHHALADHNHIQGCPHCWCAATRGEGTPRNDREDSVRPIAPGTYLPKYEPQETGREFRFRWSTTVEILVAARGEDEEEAYDNAVAAAKERLDQVAATLNGVAVHADIDGLEGEAVE